MYLGIYVFLGFMSVVFMIVVSWYALSSFFLSSSCLILSLESVWKIDRAEGRLTYVRVRGQAPDCKRCFYLST